MTKYSAKYGVEAFVREYVTRESLELRALRQDTERLPHSYMLSSPDEIALLTFVAKLIGAKRTLEVGTYTGYSALAMAQALPEDGNVMALENMLWSGSVANALPSDSTAFALRQLNLKLHSDTRVDIALVTVGDGLMLAHKR